MIYNIGFMKIFDLNHRIYRIEASNKIILSQSRLFLILMFRCVRGYHGKLRCARTLKISSIFFTVQIFFKIQDFLQENFCLVLLEHWNFTKYPLNSQKNGKFWTKHIFIRVLLLVYYSVLEHWLKIHRNVKSFIKTLIGTIRIFRRE